MAKNRLSEYRHRRDFRKTKEPKGSRRRPGADGPIFVIQKHAASTLHYDFRLEIDGVLRSWAVPKGPSTDPSQKRLAIPTEDHPLDYADFEGRIPDGEYGAGAVIVWDTGSYEKMKEEDDRLEVYLRGKKVFGPYALVRMDRDDDEQWLLVKMRGDGADARRNPVGTEPASVLSGREIDDVRERP